MIGVSEEERRRVLREHVGSSWEYMVRGAVADQLAHARPPAAVVGTVKRSPAQRLAQMIRAELGTDAAGVDGRLETTEVLRWDRR